MLNLIMLCLIITGISNLLMFISTFISKKSYLDREKSSPFECGFNPQSFTRIPFSLHFFLITLIFLIFDVEISLIFPMIKTFKMTNFLLWTYLSILFILILLLGIYHEWNQNMLKWVT
uniref:NADH-ubiquinone oxidoreductase chain 3 n=1 Tax=Acanthopsyche nigraplaga TaxID=1765094 RepID=A0A891GPT2_9NEOP|nr:NADH dehydrogenase subunit 3 [Acanthopsyche nigraplaga]QRK25809.1 NADH dehydrogenase subunit 3 [Acanthopsyche nigraplaga]